MHKAYVVYVCKHTYAKYLQIKYNSFFKNKFGEIKDIKYMYSMYSYVLSACKTIITIINQV